MDRDKRELSRYMEGNREAVIYLIRQRGVRPPIRVIVELYEDGELKDTVDNSSHDLGYAEDTAENWVMRVGSFK